MPDEHLSEKSPEIRGNLQPGETPEDMPKTLDDIGEVAVEAAEETDGMPEPVENAELAYDANADHDAPEPDLSQTNFEQPVKEEPDLSTMQEIAEAEDAPRSLIANLNKNESMTNRDSLIELLETASDKLAQDAYDRITLATREEEIAERERQSEYQRAQESVIAAILSFSISKHEWRPDAKVTLIEPKNDTNLVGVSEGYYNRRKFGFGDTAGSLTRAQIEQLRGELYQLLGVDRPTDDMFNPLPSGEKSLNSYFSYDDVVKRAVVPTSIPGVALVEDRISSESLGKGGEGERYAIGIEKAAENINDGQGQEQLAA